MYTYTYSRRNSASQVFNIRIYVCHLVSSVHTCRIHVYLVCVCVYRLVEVYVEKCRDKVDRAVYLNTNNLNTFELSDVYYCGFQLVTTLPSKLVSKGWVG